MSGTVIQCRVCVDIVLSRLSVDTDRCNFYPCLRIWGTHKVDNYRVVTGTGRQSARRLTPASSEARPWCASWAFHPSIRGRSGVEGRLGLWWGSVMPPTVERLVVALRATRVFARSLRALVRKVPIVEATEAGSTPS